MPLNREISIITLWNKNHPIFGASKFHNGIDLAANYENVYSVLDELLLKTGWDNNGGGELYQKSNTFNRFETALFIFLKFIIVSESL